jgi:uncharacterized membrane protein
MPAKVKPGLASLIVFTAAVIILFWAAVGLELPKEFYAFLSALFLLIVWWSLWRRSRKLARRVEELAGEIEASRQGLGDRAARLEAEVAELQSSNRPQAAASAAGVSSAKAAPVSAAPTTPVAAVTSAETVASAPPPPPPPPAFQPITPPAFAQTETTITGPSLFERLSSLLKFEELLGTNLIAKIGALVLVLGVAFGLNLALRSLDPPGKVAMGFALGAVLLGAGIFFERNERYRTIARAAVAAGWGIIFFTAFAMNHIPAARILASEPADLGLMMVIAAAMVVHTLRYRSQVATGLAFLAAFAGVFATMLPSPAVPPVTISSLLAAVVLAIGVAVVAVRMQWFVLEACAIAATFLNHFVWLIHIILPMGKHHHGFPEFLPSALILGSYWAIYRASYLIRRGDGHERISSLSALLNTGLLMAVLKYQSVHPEYAFWALLTLGTVELGLGQLPQARRRSTPHIVLTVSGACLLFTSIPFRVGLEAKGVALLWLAMSQAFFLVGVLTRETVFRRVGLFAFVPLAGQLISVEVARVAGARMDGSDVKGEFLAAAVCALSAVVLYIDVHWAPRRWAAQFASAIETAACRDLSYAAAIMALAAGWLAFPNLGAAVVWMALACATAWAAYKFGVEPLRWQSLGLAAFAFMRVLAVNLTSDSVYHVGQRQWPARLITIVAVVSLCYVAALWHRRAEASGLRWPSHSLTWAASTMFTLLMWYELSSVAVAVGWGIFALVMLEIGIWRGSMNLRLQAYVAGASAFLRMMFVNLNADAVSGLSPRLYTMVPLAAIFFYFYQRLDEQQASLSERERKIRAPSIFAWLGGAAIVLLLRFETPLDWVATAWAAVVLAGMMLAWWTGRRVFMHQAMLLGLAVLWRGVLHNLYERSYFHPLNRVLANLSTMSAAALLFAALVFAFRLRTKPAAGRQSALGRFFDMLDAHPEQVFFFVALVLFTVFLGVESPLVTVAWGAEAVAVFLIALWVGERSYRVSALVLLLVCIGRLFIVDIRHMVQRDRVITCIVLGALLLFVPILYSRNREKVRQYL